MLAQDISTHTSMYAYVHIYYAKKGDGKGYTYGCILWDLQCTAIYF